MEKLRVYLEKLFNGEKIKGFNLSPMEIYILRDIYNDVANKESSTFLNSNIKEVLDSCGIKTKVCGVGWKVVL